MADFPALPLFTDSLVADTDHLTDEEFGAYLRMLIVSWRSSSCDMPNDLAWIKRRFVGAREHPEVYEQLVEEFFTKRGSRLQQKRLMKEREYVENKRAKQSARAKSRWNKENDECRGNAAPHASGNAPTPTPTPTPTPLKESESPLSPPKGAGTKRKRATVWPDDLALTRDRWEYALKCHPGVDAKADWERFRLWAQSNGKTFVDWHKAWQSWCRSPYDKPMTNGNGPVYAASQHQKRGPQLLDRIAAAEETPVRTPTPHGSH